MASITPSSLEEKIQNLAQKYSKALLKQINCRLEEMKGDDTSHFLIYRVLGITEQEGKLIDIYQNKGRFLYKYAGSFLEKATQLSFLEKYPNSKAVKITNSSANFRNTL